MNQPFKSFYGILKDYVSEKAITFYLPNMWGDKRRFYHTTTHLTWVLKNIEQNISFKYLNVYEKAALVLGAFFHDAIYDPRKKDNEDESIRFFKSSYISKDAKMLHVVCNLIEVTKHRKRPAGKLERIIWDADNATFKENYDQYLLYEKLIRKEFEFVPPKEYKEARVKFLESCKGLFGIIADKNLDKLIEYVQKTY
jgi:predicted metal-dependent HD superfamily phosphohydrolase